MDGIDAAAEQSDSHPLKLTLGWPKIDAAPSARFDEEGRIFLYWPGRGESISIEDALRLSVELRECVDQVGDSRS